MELFKEILINILAKEDIRVTFPNLKLSAPDLIEMYSFHALQKIKAIVQNDSLSDFECVEQIVCALEAAGNGGGSRHGFG